MFRQGGGLAARAPSLRSREPIENPRASYQPGRGRDCACVTTDVMTRRTFLSSTAAAGFVWSWPIRAKGAPVPFPVQYRKPNPYEKLRPLLDPGHDAFAVEAEAAAITTHWNRSIGTGALPLAEGFRGYSPLPKNYKSVADGVAIAEYDKSDRGFESGLKQWIAKLGSIRNSRFIVLPGDRLRFEIASSASGLLNYRVGLWKQVWRGEQLAE